MFIAYRDDAKNGLMKALMLLAAASGVLSTPLAAQTRSIRDTATAYGARLNAKGLPADLNQNRISNRIDNRIDNRLSLRIERYRPDNTANPTAAYQAAQDDKSHIAPMTAAAPPNQSEQNSQ